MAWSGGRPWAGDARALSFVELGRKISRGRIDGEKKARGIAQGMLKATCASLAHLSKEYAGKLAAARRQLSRSMPRQPDVMNYIADGDARRLTGCSASALRSNGGCSRRRSKRPSMHVRKWPHDALARPFTTTCSGGRVGPTSNAFADQSPIAGLSADAAGRGAGRMADAGRRAAAQTAALRSLLSTAPWPG